MVFLGGGGVQKHDDRELNWATDVFLSGHERETGLGNS